MEMSLFPRLALAFSLALIPLQAQTASDSISSQIQPILGELSKISGFTIKRAVPYETFSKDQLRKYLEERVKTTTTPEKLRAEEVTLKKFGLVPPDFNLEGATVDLMTEQAAAFYDDEKRKMFLVEGAPSMMEQIALVHELAHALADQHFSLGKYVERDKPSDDAQMARMAVVEGQAMWLMMEYTMQKMGQSLLKSRGLLDMVSKSADMSGGQFPVFDKAPLYLRETLLFPYTAGLKFQQEILLKSGTAGFQDVFRQPPQSTQQVMHFQAYVAKVKPTTPALPQFSKSGYKQLTEGSVGELDHYIFLKQYAKSVDPSEFASHLRGSQFQIVENKKANRIVLRYASEWDGPESAAHYFEQYQNILKGKWKEYAPAPGTETRLSGRGDDGYFLLQRSGAIVTSLEGMAEDPAEQQ